MKKHALAIALLSLLGGPAMATTFIVSMPSAMTYAPGEKLPSTSGIVRPPGLYVSVQDGAIVLTNSAGVQNLTAGQFGFTPSSVRAPVMLPADPGLKFTLPPTLGSPSAGIAPSSGSSGVDCIVR